MANHSIIFLSISIQNLPGIQASSEHIARLLLHSHQLQLERHEERSEHSSLKTGEAETTAFSLISKKKQINFY